MVLRRLAGIRWPSLPAVFCPVRSVSVRTATFNSGCTKPNSRLPRGHAWTTEGASSARSLSRRAAMPSPPSTSTVRVATVALGDEHGPPAVREPALGVGRALAVSPRYVSGACMPSCSVSPSRSASAANRGHRPPHHAELAGPVADVRDGPQRRGAHVDGGVAAGRGGRPGRLEELLRGGDEVGGPGPYPLRVADHGHRSGGQHVEEQFHVVDEDRREGLHALDGDALGDLAQQFAQLRVLFGEGRRSGAYVGGEQQLPAGRRPQAVLGDLQGPLVGDLEVADLLDVVAPELDPERVLLGRREDVEDAAADRELAALLDEFDAGVRGRGERLDRLVQIGAPPGAQRDGLQVAEPLHLRLQHRADGRDHHGHRAGLRVVGAGVGEAAQHGEAPAHGVGARGEPLVRQRLPRRVLDDAVRRQQRAQRRGRSSASRPVAVTASTGRFASRASAATVKGRDAGGPTRSMCMRLPSPAAFTASVRAASLTTASSSPCRLMGALTFPVLGWATQRTRHV